MTATWVFPPAGQFQVQGRDLSEDNFAQEERTSLEILMREALQNPLDARASDNNGPVRVRLRVLQARDIDPNYLDRLVPSEYRERLEASGGESLPSLAAATALVIEDFGTTGLQGTFTDLNADGSFENWNAFWFREGEGAKSAPGSNGRAGQGKITYYRIGAARAVFGYTIRHSDRKTLLMGRSSFRRVYPFGGSGKFLRHSFWSVDPEQALPESDPNALEAFRRAFRLARTTEPGLSLVIPYPYEFDAKAAVRTIISEFYYPIARGRLEVAIGDTTISATNIDTIAGVVLPDDEAKRRRSAFTKGFRGLVQKVIEDQKSGAFPTVLNPGWEKSSSLEDKDFPSGSVQDLRDRMENGQHIFVRCPITVKQKKGETVSTWFDVHLEVPDELEKTEEAYVRRDLLIGSESHLAASSYLQKARGLTLIEEEAISAFMADAEEPTHLKWNASRPRLAEDYSNPGATVRAVRLALPRLLAFLSGGIVKRDRKTLARFFSKPATEGTRHVPGGGRQGEKDTTPNKEELPEPVRKPFRLVTGTNTIRVLPNGSVAPKSGDLPVVCTLEVAYEGLDQNPFRNFDPFDFDLVDEQAYPVSLKGIRVLDKVGNRIEFEVTDPEFALEVAGFDSNIRLRARLNYTEKSDGTAVDAE